MEKVYKVVIVGGGMAGIGTASRLCKYSSTFDVKLLETGVELGGRCRSIKLSGVPVELGATFLHGTTGNVLYRLASEAGIASYPNVLPNDDSLWVTSSGREPVILKECLMLFSEAIKVSSEYRKKVDMKRFLTDTYNELALAKGLMNENTRDLTSALLRQFLLNRGVIEGSHLCEGVSTDMEYDSPEGPEDNSFELPYCSADLISLLTKDIPKDVIQLDCTVESIEWNPWEAEGKGMVDYPVRVRSSKGVYSCDHVIVTLPLGVIKQYEKKMSVSNGLRDGLFIPPLPAGKLEAIAGIKIDLVNKMIVEFPTPFLAKEVTSVELVWLEEDLRDVFVQKFPWVGSLFQMMKLKDSNVMIFFVTGSAAQTIPHLSQQELADGVCYVLQRFLQCAIPSPTRIICSDWGSKPFYGSYSYNINQDSHFDRLELSKPLVSNPPNQVLFAGEATHCREYSTIHGAYKTGIREADRLLECVMKNDIRS